MSEARIDRLEDDIRDIKETLKRLEPIIVSINAQLPHLATKAELADLRTELKTDIARLPTHAYLWGVMAAIFGAQTVALAAAALIIAVIQARVPAPTPTHANVVIGAHP